MGATPASRIQFIVAPPQSGVPILRRESAPERPARTPAVVAAVAAFSDTPLIVVAHRLPTPVKVQYGSSVLTTPRSRSPSRYFRRPAERQHQICERSDLSLQRARRELHLRLCSNRRRQVWRVPEGERFADLTDPQPRTTVADLLNSNRCRGYLPTQWVSQAYQGSPGNLRFP